MAYARRGRKPFKAFLAQFKFSPVQGEGDVAKMQRALERAIVRQELTMLWRWVEQCESELRQRDPPSWMETFLRRTIPDRKRLNELLPVLRERFARAERLARAFGLHPDQPFKQE
jgi:hypothetical protein